MMRVRFKPDGGGRGISASGISGRRWVIGMGMASAVWVMYPHVSWPSLEAWYLEPPPCQMQPWSLRDSLEDEDFLALGRANNV
jgi:hypothetical protein